MKVSLMPDALRHSPWQEQRVLRDHCRQRRSGLWRITAGDPVSDHTAMVAKIAAYGIDSVVGTLAAFGGWWKNLVVHLFFKLFVSERRR